VFLPQAMWFRWRLGDGLAPAGLLLLIALCSPALSVRPESDDDFTLLAVEDDLVQDAALEVKSGGHLLSVHARNTEDPAATQEGEGGGSNAAEVAPSEATGDASDNEGLAAEAEEAELAAAEEAAAAVPELGYNNSLAHSQDLAVHSAHLQNESSELADAAKVVVDAAAAYGQALKDLDNGTEGMWALSHDLRGSLQNQEDKGHLQKVEEIIKQHDAENLSVAYEPWNTFEENDPYNIAPVDTRIPTLDHFGPLPANVEDALGNALQRTRDAMEESKESSEGA
jgi:hypothetical protein